MNQFTLNDLFAKQFGYTPQTIEVPKESVRKKSTTGKYGSYYAKDLQGRDVFMPMTLGGLFLPYVWFNISGTKRYVETDLTERRGSVTEYVSMNDYRMSVKGLLIGHDGSFPEKDVEDLKTLWERAEALEIKCILTDIFLLTNEHGGQDKVLMQNFNLAENPGVEHVRGFTFDLKTDQQFELEILE